MLEKCEQLNNVDRDHLDAQVSDFFIIDDELITHLQTSIKFASQTELDSQIHHLSLQKHTGLNQEIADAICERDKERLDWLKECANNQAIIGTKLRLCRYAVSRIMYNNRHQTSVKNESVV